jgi:hypothetical protein
LNPFPVGRCASFRVLLSVSTPLLTRCSTEDWIIAPSFPVSFAFVGTVLFRMLFLPFGSAVAYAFQPFRLGMSPLPYSGAWQGLQRMSVDSAETG